MLIQEEHFKQMVAEALVARINHVYRDFIENKEGFHLFPSFFRDHLYLPEDKEKRDIALEKLHNKLRSITGPKMAENMDKIIKLNKLTDELDRKLGKYFMNKLALENQGGRNGGIEKKWTWLGRWSSSSKSKKEVPDTQITEKDVFRAIKQTNQFEQRCEQIELIGDSLIFFFSLSRLTSIRLILAPIKVAALMVGTGNLIKTIEVGYELARNIKAEDFHSFVASFREREKINLQKIMKL